METIKPKKIISCLPAFLFLMGILFFSFSPLTISRVLVMQNEAFLLFYQELKETSLIPALISAFEYVWMNVIWIVLVFLILISSGFLIYVLFLESLDLKVVVVSQILFLVIATILTSFSMVTLLTSLSLFLGILWLHKTFEPRKSDFSTGYSVTTSKLGLMNVFLAIGLFLMIFLNLPVYEEKITKSNVGFMVALIPESTNLKEAQKKEVLQLTEGFQYVLKERYDYMTEETKTQCKSMYESLNQGIENYKNSSIQKIEKEELGMSKEEIVETIPFAGILTKISPLITAISAYALLSILTLFLGMFGGIFYSLLRRIKA